MNMEHELIEMNSKLLSTHHRICIIKQIHQHGLTATNLTIKIGSCRLLVKKSEKIGERGQGG